VAALSGCPSGFRSEEWCADFAQYVKRPELAALLPVLYPGVFPNLAGLTAERAEKLARANGLHELLHRLENPPVIQAPVRFNAESNAILTAVDELEGAELVGASA